MVILKIILKNIKDILFSCNSKKKYILKTNFPAVFKY